MDGQQDQLASRKKEWKAQDADVNLKSSLERPKHYLETEKHLAFLYRIFIKITTSSSAASLNTPSSDLHLRCRPHPPRHGLCLGDPICCCQGGSMKDGIGACMIQVTSVVCDATCCFAGPTVVV